MARNLWKVLVIATMLCATFLALALSLSLATLARGELDLIAVSSEAPGNSVSPSPSFISFSIEQDRWTDWSGTSSRNIFFSTVLDNLRLKSGSAPHIRIGANSEDRTIFDPSVQFAEDHFPSYTATVPYPEANNISVGDGYYRTARFLPENTHVTWGVNFGQDNISAAILEAQSIFKAFSSDAFIDANIVLDAIEIGNEPDLYHHNGDRPASYSLSEYLSEWSIFADSVSEAAHINSNSRTKFWIGALAESSHSTTGFSPQAFFANNFPDSSMTNLVSTYSQHHYSASFCTGSAASLQELMSKANVRGNLSAFVPDIAIVRAQGFEYVLGETNSISCHGAPNVSNTAGAALWALDYGLYASSIGITRLFFHEGIGFKYAAIQPITLTRSILDGSPLPQPLPPHVQPLYYAAIIIAEAIGSSRSVRMAEILIADPNISGYAFYEDNMLARAVFINSNAYFEGERPMSHIMVDIPGGAYTEIHVKRLAIGYASDTSGLTWGGQSYETPTGLVSGSEHVDIRPISRGVDIRATEAVLVHFA